MNKNYESKNSTGNIYNISFDDSHQKILTEKDIKKLTLRNNYTKLLSKEEVKLLSKLNLDNSPLEVYPYYSQPGNIDIIGDIPKFISHKETNFMNKQLELINKFNQYYNDKFKPLQKDNE